MKMKENNIKDDNDKIFFSLSLSSLILVHLRNQHIFLKRTNIRSVLVFVFFEKFGKNQRIFFRLSKTGTHDNN